ncbi:MAG: aspartate aminotransferase family protein [Myxococcota bacterium]|jgi:predicted acetylornithine/succinylornithine family transaminase
MNGTAQAIFDLDRDHVYPTYARFPIVFTHGSGLELYDSKGRRYTDFLSGIAVNALGHAHPRVTAALSAQAGRIVHTSNLFHNEHQAPLARKICEVTGMSRVFFCNSGTEATEAAIKVARRTAWLSSGESPVKSGIVALNGSFHGRTMGALSVTGQEKFRTPFEPLIPGVTFVDPGDTAALLKAIGPNTCAVLMEPIQGEGGVKVLDGAFMAAAREACDRYDALLIFDEVQCGLGRTGHWLASQESGVKADLVTLAKPLGLGVPMGALAGTERTREAFTAGSHGSTFGGGPLACALSLELFRTIEEENLLPHIKKAGAHLAMRLGGIAAKNPIVKEVRGAGLMVGMELTVPGKPAVAAMLDRGFIINCTHDTVLRFLPPYIVTVGQIDEMTGVLAGVLGDPAIMEPLKS